MDTQLIISLMIFCKMLMSCQTAEICITEHACVTFHCLLTIYCSALILIHRFTVIFPIEGCDQLLNSQGSEIQSGHPDLPPVA